MFGVSLSTYLISKEIYVMEHEYYTGLSILLMVIYATKKFGPTVAAYLDKEIDQQVADLNESRTSEIDMYENQIKDEKKAQWQAEGQTLLMEAKRQNIAMQLEAAYRERLATVYSEVRKDYYQLYFFKAGNSCTRINGCLILICRSRNVSTTTCKFKLLSVE